MSLPTENQAQQPTASPISPETVGYVLKMYPRFSETFVISEILAREAAGEKIVVFSLRPSTDTRFHAELARVKAPVVHIPRTSSASRFWRMFQTVHEKTDQHQGETADPSSPSREVCKQALSQETLSKQAPSEQAPSKQAPSEQAPSEQALSTRALSAPALSAQALSAQALSAALPELMLHEHDDVYQAIALAEAAHEHGVTHLHAHFASVATTVARLAGMIASLPYSFTAHAKDIFHQGVDRHQLQAKLAGAHHTVTISRYNLEHLRNEFPVSTQRLHLVRNGLEIERFPYAPARESRGTDPARLLAIGRLVEKKGFNLLIDAIAELRDQGIRVQADIAGDGPLAPQLRAQVELLGLEEEVRLIGAQTQSEINAMLGSHDVFVAPFVIGQDGNADGLPTVLLEAMARGIPCVAADVTAVPEVIRAGKTGWLVPTGELAQLVKAVREAISFSPQQRRELTDAARCLVEDLFDSRRQAADLQHLVNQPPASDSDHDSALQDSAQRDSAAEDRSPHEQPQHDPAQHDQPQPDPARSVSRTKDDQATTIPVLQKEGALL